MDPLILDCLDDVERAWWRGEIQSFRKRIVKSPSHYIQEALVINRLTRETIQLDFDQAIFSTRALSYASYLKDESRFHAQVFKHLSEQREIPRLVLEELALKINFSSENESSVVVGKIAELTGEYVGRIFPYVYELSLSTTQSRRSRAGKEFEALIEFVLKILEIKFETQAAIGKKRFESTGLGKIVDVIVPGIAEYGNHRQNCAVITAKTTLRERWAEVAEELQRTNVPKIYLLTLDEDISIQTVDLMKQYNITLVMPAKNKDQKFSDNARVLSFEQFFSHDLPHVLSYFDNPKLMLLDEKLRPS